MQTTFCALAGDARQQAAVQALQKAGWLLQDGAAGAQVALLPMSPQPGQQLQQFLAALRPGTLVLGGRLTPDLHKTAEQAGLEMIDYALCPDLAEKNAIPTAEGCLALLMKLRDRTLWQSSLLVLGYGRVGRAVSRRLTGLGAWVTVAARNADQRRAARTAGCHAAPLTALPRILPGFDGVVNTIPAPVLGERELACLPRNGLVLDLSSRPFGTDFAAARRLGIRALAAPGLPGRCAPRTAGELIAETVLRLVQERRDRP